jgi:ribosome-binding protein aMBF1 (putative translation factor)
MTQTDPLVAALDAVAGRRTGGLPLKIDALYGERPEVLDAIRSARRDKHLSYEQIAEALSTAGDSITDGAVSKWLKREGIA